MENKGNLHDCQSSRFGPLLAVATTFFPGLISGQSIKVQVRDALSGSPQAHVSVQYFCEGSGWTGLSTKTDMLGMAEVPFTCGAKGKIELSVSAENGKEECGGLASETAQEISSKGFISAPNGAGGIWCPTKISRKMKPIPGEIAIFIKKPTWWQSHVAG